MSRIWLALTTIALALSLLVAQSPILDPATVFAPDEACSFEPDAVQDSVLSHSSHVGSLVQVHVDQSGADRSLEGTRDAGSAGSEVSGAVEEETPEVLTWNWESVLGQIAKLAGLWDANVDAKAAAGQAETSANHALEYLGTDKVKCVMHAVEKLGAHDYIKVKVTGAVHDLNDTVNRTYIAVHTRMERANSISESLKMFSAGLWYKDQMENFTKWIREGIDDLEDAIKEYDEEHPRDCSAACSLFASFPVILPITHFLFRASYVW